MSLDNVTLWFAKDKNNSIITIDEINDKNRHEPYYCPMCNSDIIPRAIGSKQVTEHFAHIDASKCNNETMIHWWFKHKFLEKGDNFIVVSDEERKYVCKDVLVEQTYALSDGKIYRPDVTIITECGETIFFEMNYSNKKKVQDYIDTWLELGNIVVEVDIKTLMNKGSLMKFNALFYNGKCFRVKKNDTYYNIIGVYKEKIYRDKVDEETKERLQKLDWFWNDIVRYKLGELTIEYMTDLIDAINNAEKEVVKQILNKKSCVEIYRKYINYKIDKIYKDLINFINREYDNDFQHYVGHSIVEYHKNNITGYIRFDDLTDNSYELYDITKYDFDYIIQQCQNCLNRNKVYLVEHEKDKYWDDTTKELILKYNEYFIPFNEEVIKKGYKLSVWFDYSNKRDYILKYNLKFKDGWVAIRGEFKHLDNFELIDIIKNDVYTYFKQLDKFNKNYDVNVLLQKLNDYFDGILQFSGDLCLEDVYKISYEYVQSNKSYLYNNDFYLNNNGILKDARSCNYSLLSDNYNTIKVFIIGEVKYVLNQQTERKCPCCKKVFKLSFNEIKYYNNKKFDYPKRCHDCIKNNRR